MSSVDTGQGHAAAMSEDLARALQEMSRSPQLAKTVLDTVSEGPQLPCNVRHLFGPGVYMREIAAPAGTVLIGRTHRRRHPSIVAAGALTFFGADGARTQVKAERQFLMEAGRLTAHVDEDLVLVTVYDTAEREMEALEALIFSDSLPLPAPAPAPPDGDYEALLAELGSAAAEMMVLAARADDVCAFPDGAYKCKVGRSRIEGRGLIATADIEPGERISVATWDGKRTPAARYTNHAKKPNAAFLYGPDGSALLLALKAISGCRGGRDGEEITVDYRRMPGALFANRSVSPCGIGEFRSRRMQ